MSSSMQLTSGKCIGPRNNGVSVRQATSGGLGGSSYNPISGTFHPLGRLSSDSEGGSLNGRFKSVDEVDDTASSHGGGADVDCMSNNGSCSGDSEDQPHTSSKDKVSLVKPEAGGTDSKRDKIRVKNERKHQRQKEKRAQELREKCNGYLVSRKLEGLSQKLVAMGFSTERSTMALIVNNGHVEQSVAWLLEGGENQLRKDWSPGGNVKLDISEELERLLEIEKKYRFSRPDIERAVVSCEGDLEKALDLLRERNVTAGMENECKIESRKKDAGHSACAPVFFGSFVAGQSKSSLAEQSPHQSRNVAGPFFREGLVADFPAVEVEVLRNAARMQCVEPQSLVAGVERITSSQCAPMKSSTISPSFMPVSSAESGLVFGFNAPDPVNFFSSTKNTTVKESAHRGQGGVLWQSNSRLLSAPKKMSTTRLTTSSSSLTRQELTEVGSPSSVLHVHDDARIKGLATHKFANQGLELGPGDRVDRINSLLAIQMESRGLSWNAAGRGLSHDAASPLSLSLSASQLGSPSGSFLSPPLSASQSGSSSGSSCGLFSGWGGGAQQPTSDWSSGPLRKYDYSNIDWSMNVLPQAATQGSSNQVKSSMPQAKLGYPWDFEGSRRFQTSRTSSFSPDWMIGGSFGAKIPDNISKDFRNSGFQEWTSPFTGKGLFNLPPSVSSLFF